jgi:signal transduction histidine kinase/ABC-type amino acid transport substrate-binding protein/CheY-like chemotaxis protein
MRSPLGLLLGLIVLLTPTRMASTGIGTGSEAKSKTSIKTGVMRVGRATALGLFLLLLLLSHGVDAQQTYRWRAPATPSAVQPGFLTDAEQAYLASLPEIRVAIAKRGAAPYEVVEANGEVHGFQADLLLALAQLLNLKVRPVVYDDWPQVLGAVRDRQADMVLTITVTPDRVAYIAYTVGTVPVPMALFTRPAPAVTPPPEEASFALEDEYASQEAVRRRYPQATVISTSSTAESLRAVMSGQADYYLGGVLETLHESAKLGAGQAAPQPGALQLRATRQVGSGYYHLGVRKDWALLATLLNRGIDSLGQTPRAALTEALRGANVAATAPRALALSAEAQAWVQQNSVLRVGAVRGLSLMNDVTSAGTHTGIAADYTEHVAQRFGVGVDVHAFDSVAEMMTALRDKRIDLVPFLNRVPYRDAELAYSKPFITVPYVLVGRSDGPAFWDLSSLRGRRVALSQDRVLGPILAERYPEVQLLSAADSTAALDMVANGEADAAVEVKVLANLRVHEGRGDLRILADLSDLPGQYHFGANAQTRVLLPAIDTALNELAPAERERMLRRWIALDLRPGFDWRRWWPVITAVTLAVLTLLGSGLWWARRLQSEVRRRRRADKLIDDVGRTVPGVVFRYVVDDKGVIRSSFLSSGSGRFLGLQPSDGAALLRQALPRVDEAHRKRLHALLDAAQSTGKGLQCSVPYAHPDGRQLWLHVEALQQKKTRKLSRNHKRRQQRGGHAHQDANQDPRDHHDQHEHLAEASDSLLGAPADGGSFEDLAPANPRPAAAFTEWTGYVVDVTQRQALLERVEHEADERYVMLATASHELRAPAHTLALALQSLPDQAVGSAHRKTLNLARDAARTMGQLLDDVLDSARAGFGYTQLRPQSFNLHALFEQVAESQAKLIAQKGLSFGHHIAPGTPRTVVADPLRLKQVLTNVLNNAAKYTQNGGIEFVMQPGRLPGQGSATAEMNAVHFSVTDTGPGIAPEIREHLFQPFVAAQPGLVGDPLVEGLRSTGLGLAHCQRLLELMKGSITLVSEPGTGTQVSVLLPLLAGAGTEPITPWRKAGAVLVCDDDAVSRLLLSETLAHLGYDCETASTAAEALQRWRMGGAEGVRLLLTDLNMPGTTGAELVQAIRQEEAASASATRTALVICSGDPAPVLTDGQAPLHDGFLSKPVDMQALLDTFQRLGLQPKQRLL